MKKLYDEELYGLETEHDIYVHETLPDKTIFVRDIREPLLKIIEELIIIAGLERPRNSAYGDKYNFSRRNGGKFYIDMGRVLESCTPECKNIKDLILWHLAQETDLQKSILAYEKKNPRHYLALLKDNSTRKKKSLGSHESYFISNDLFEYPLNDFLLYQRIQPYLAPFLAVRPIICGAGKISKEIPLIFAEKELLSNRIRSFTGSNETGTPIHPYYNRWQKKMGKIFSHYTFQISQRADYITRLHNTNTVKNRPLIHIKDAASGNGMRLHLICGDSNRCSKSLFLRMGTVKLILKTYLEGGFMELPPQLHDPILSLIKISRDPELKKKIRLKNGSLVSPLFIHEYYIEKIKNHLIETRQFNGENAEILELWEEVVRCLKAGEFKKLFGILDWITRKLTIDAVCQQKGLCYDDKKIQKLDTCYADLHPKRSIFEALKHQDKIQMLFSGREIQLARFKAPKSRTAFRALILQLLKSSGLKYQFEHLNWEFIEGYIELDYRFLHSIKKHFPVNNQFLNIAEIPRQQIIEWRFKFDMAKTINNPLLLWEDIVDFANFIKVIQKISKMSNKKTASE